MNLELKTPTISYCYEKCITGRQAAEKYLRENNSVSDAAIDFQYFVEDCYKNCPYKDAHKGVNDDNF